MENDNIKADQMVLKKLREKAELCRFSHSELKEEYTRYRNWKEFAVVLLSIISAALVGLYYREYREVGDNDLILSSNLVLSSIFVLPLVITLIQALDSTVFQWTHKLTRHESAVAIWGNWIREADFFEKRICQYSSDLENEKMQNIQEKYNSCMSSTEQIPNSKFLKLKKKFKLHKLHSKEIDQMPVEDLETGNKK